MSETLIPWDALIEPEASVLTNPASSDAQVDKAIEWLHYLLRVINNKDVLNEFETCLVDFKAFRKAKTRKELKALLRARVCGSNLHRSLTYNTTMAISQAEGMLLQKKMVALHVGRQTLVNNDSELTLGAKLVMALLNEIEKEAAAQRPKIAAEMVNMI